MYGRGDQRLKGFCRVWGRQIGRGIFWSKSSRKERWLSRIAEFIIPFMHFIFLLCVCSSETLFGFYYPLILWDSCRYIIVIPRGSVDYPVLISFGIVC